MGGKKTRTVLGFIGSIGLAIAAPYLMASTALGLFGGGAVVIAGSLLLSKLLPQEMADIPTGAEEAKQMLKSNEAPIPLHYGIKRTGCNIIYAQYSATGWANVSSISNITYDMNFSADHQLITSTKNYSFLHLIVGIGEGEIESVEKVWLGEEKIGYINEALNGSYEYIFDGDVIFNGAVIFDGAVIKGIGCGASDVMIRKGTALQFGFGPLLSMANYGMNYVSTDTFPYTACAYVCLRMDEDNKVWSGVPTLNFLVKGIKCLSYPTSPYSRIWTRSAQDIVADLMVGQEERYGLGLSVSDLDTSSFDAVQSYIVSPEANGSYGVAGTDGIILYTDYSVTGQDITTSIHTALSGCDLSLVKYDKKYKIVINQAGLPVFNFSEDTDDIDNLNVITDSLSTSIAGREARPNTITIKYTSMHDWNFGYGTEEFEYRYIAAEYKEGVNAWIKEDGKIIDKSFTIDSISNKEHAMWLAKRNVIQGRLGNIAISFNTLFKCFKIKPGDIVSYTSPRKGWDEKWFIIDSVITTPTTPMQFTAIEYVPEVYNPVSGNTRARIFNDVSLATGMSDTTNLGIFDPPPIAGIKGYIEASVDEGSRTGVDMRITWDNPNHAFVKRFKIYYYEKASTSSWDDSTVQYAGASIDTYHIIQNVKMGWDYKIAVTAEIYNSDAKPLPDNFVEINVVPPTTKPDNIEDFIASFNSSNNTISFEWTESSNRHIFYEIRKGSTWQTSELIAIVKGGNTYTTNNFYTSTQVFLIKTVNLWNIKSESASSYEIDCGVVQANMRLLLTNNDSASGYPGSKVNCALNVDGDLEMSSSGSSMRYHSPMITPGGDQKVPLRLQMDIEYEAIINDVVDFSVSLSFGNIGTETFGSTGSATIYGDYIDIQYDIIHWVDPLFSVGFSNKTGVWDLHGDRFALSVTLTPKYDNIRCKLISCTTKCFGIIRSINGEYQQASSGGNNTGYIFFDDSAFYASSSLTGHEPVFRKPPSISYTTDIPVVTDTLLLNNPISYYLNYGFTDGSTGNTYTIQWNATGV